MSASNTVALRLDHLAKASQALATSSPATSGHLRSAHQRLATGEGKPVSSPSHLRICSACGSSLIWKWNCEAVKSEASGKKRTRQDRLQKQSSTRILQVRCSRCDSITEIESTKASTAEARSPERILPIEIQIVKSLAPHPLVPKIQTSEPPPAPTSKPSGIKKRSRNKNSSLQYMLENRKPTGPAKGFDLGLANFMTG